MGMNDATKKELANLDHNAVALEKDDEELRKMFDRLDVDGSNSLDKQEVAQLSAELGKARTKSRRRTALFTDVLTATLRVLLLLLF